MISTGHPCSSPVVKNWILTSYLYHVTFIQALNKINDSMSDLARLSFIGINAVMTIQETNQTYLL